jgi:hypothetical protein
MEITEQEYLENRKKTGYSEEIFNFTSGATYKIDQIKKCLEEVETKFSNKEDVRIWIDPARYDCEDYDTLLMVSWVDWESKEDYEKRMWEKKWAKERAVDSLKRLINNNKEEAVKIIKDLSLV